MDGSVRSDLPSPELRRLLIEIGEALKVGIPRKPGIPSRLLAVRSWKDFRI